MNYKHLTLNCKNYKKVFFSNNYLPSRYSVRSLLSSSNSVTFCMTRVPLSVSSSMSTNSGVHHNACHLQCLITPLYLYIVLAMSSAVTNLPNKTSIFHDFQGPQLNSMTFQVWKMKFLNSMTFQVFHDLYEPWDNSYPNTLDFLSAVTC